MLHLFLRGHRSHGLIILKYLAEMQHYSILSCSLNTTVSAFHMIIFSLPTWTQIFSCTSDHTIITITLLFQCVTLVIIGLKNKCVAVVVVCHFHHCKYKIHDFLTILLSYHFELLRCHLKNKSRIAGTQFTKPCFNDVALSEAVYAEKACISLYIKTRNPTTQESL